MSTQEEAEKAAVEREEQLLTIKEASEITGFSEDTIRYYEKIGLLSKVKRKANRHRIYTLQDINLLKLIACLKKTGMPLDEMKPFLHIAIAGDFTIKPEAVGMILRHKGKIQQQIDMLQKVVNFIDTNLEQQKWDPEQTDCVLKETPVSPLNSIFTGIN